MKRFVYADNAATTQVSPRVLEAMKPWLLEQYGNPSSIYSIGRQARTAVETARRQVAAALDCEPNEVYFTSGGSEADNWALKGTAHLLAKQGKRHLITTNFEHHAILHTCAALEKEGFEVTYLPVDSKGLVTAEQVRQAIRPDTALVSIMYANNEIGTVQPISEIAAVCKEAGVRFHTDAVQAVGHLPISVREQNITTLSLSAHKLHGPKGVGALIVRKGFIPPNLIDGGGQEKGRRAGTENVSGIVGLGEAITAAVEKMEEETPRVTALRDRLIDGLVKLPKVRLNGDRQHRLPGNVNLSFEGIEGESLLLMLDYAGICASSGSACTSGSLDPSHVLLAIGLPHEVAHGSLRLTLGDQTTDEDVDYILEQVPPIVERLRSMSPVWEKIKDL
ncbi:cysteine desulfurase NifS [Angelakisella massiliensis]|uniref:cysteine desulfurase NifS n=1 Tax=Angelakisella massiliensis TaxID=1871018 RepID=UPI0024B1DF82|nr:cysteine desulfurase NifS [Angelakisella massiliensis]